MQRSLSEALLVFEIEQRFFGLAVSTIDEVQRAVEVLPLPDAPQGIRGVINLHGSMIPVIDLRLLRGHIETPIRASNELIIAQTAMWKVAIIAEDVVGVVEPDGSHATVADEIVPGLASIRGMTQFHGEVVMIDDVDRLLSKEVATALETPMNPDC